MSQVLTQQLFLLILIITQILILYLVVVDLQFVTLQIMLKDFASIQQEQRVLIGVNASYANASIDELQIGNNNSSNQSGLTIGSTDECAIAFADAGDATFLEV